MIALFLCRSSGIWRVMETRLYKDIIKDNVDVQEYLAYIKSMQKSPKSQYLFQLKMKMNSMKIPG